jgi:Flp pilus assembly protein TadD
VACTDLKQYSEAIAHLNRAVELNPHFFEANYSLGYALELAGEKELADLYFRRAQAIRPWVPRPEISKKGE